MTKQRTRQVLAIGSLVGLFFITMVAAVFVYNGIDVSGVDLVYTGWLSLTSTSMAFYFTERDEHSSSSSSGDNYAK